MSASIGANYDLESIRKIIGADSLAFLSVNGIYRAMGEDKRDPLNTREAPA